MPYTPPYSITHKILDLVSQIMEKLGSLNTVNGLDKLPRLRKISRLKSIYSSLAIENNPLSLGNVTDVINGHHVIGKEEDIIAVKNAYEAYNTISKVNPYSLDDLLKVHKIMMNGIVIEAGLLRSKAVGVFDENGNVVHIAPPANMVKKNVDDLFAWLKTSKDNILIKSCIFHYELEFIHPFNDGNGRMGRLWQTVILAKWKPIFEWIPIESIIKKNQEEYYLAITSSTKSGTSTPFIEFMLSCILKAIDETIVSSKEHYNHLSKQIGDLLNVIEDYPQSATAMMNKLELKSRNSFRNHYLKPALEAGLIAMTDPNKPNSRSQKYYLVNTSLLTFKNIQKESRSSALENEIRLEDKDH